MKVGDKGIYHAGKAFGAGGKMIMDFDVEVERVFPAFPGLVNLTLFHKGVPTGVAVCADASAFESTENTVD